MDLFGINGYCLNKRAALVLEQGTFVTERHTDRYCIALYHMGDFYAEVWHLRCSNKLVLVRGYKNKEYLQPFLDTIDISALSC